MQNFDFIALPKGQAPGGPVQASDGEWYLVIPFGLDLNQIVDWVIDMRRGLPITDDEKRILKDRLQANLNGSPL